jgi:hypothetical protein
MPTQIRHVIAECYQVSKLQTDVAQAAISDWQFSTLVQELCLLQRAVGQYGHSR